MNDAAGTDATHPYIALDGRVPTKVYGPCNKFDYLVLSPLIAGVAVAYSDPKWAPLAIGRALEAKTDFETGLIEASVKRGI